MQKEIEDQQNQLDTQQAVNDNLQTTIDKLSKRLDALESQTCNTNPVISQNPPEVKHNDAGTRCLSEAGRDRYEVGRNIREHNSLFEESAFPHQPFTDTDGLSQRSAAMRVAR